MEHIVHTNTRKTPVFSERCTQMLRWGVRSVCVIGGASVGVVAGGVTGFFIYFYQYPPSELLVHSDLLIVSTFAATIYSSCVGGSVGAIVGGKLAKRLLENHAD